MRPEKISLIVDQHAADVPSGWNMLRGRVEDVVYLGTHSQIVVRLADAAALTVLRQNHSTIEPTLVRGEPVAIPIERANAHTVAELLAALAAERERTLAFIAALTPEQFDRRASHRLFGSLTVLQWLRSFYRHDRMHIDQMAGREPSYRPRYTTGVEPDQRRR
ncbi:MAG: hypothetical protein C4345_03285 [Chloroflexota bacterium]